MWPPFWDGVWMGLLLINCAALGWNAGAFWRTRKRQAALHVKLENVRQDLATSLEMVTMHPVEGWRALDPQARQALRAALVRTVADMDAEPPTLH